MHRDAWDAWPDLHTKARAPMAVCLSLSGHSHREHQLMSTEDGTIIVLSLCPSASHWHLWPWHSTRQGLPAQPCSRKSREGVQGAKSPRCCLSRYPQYPIPICRQMALIICVAVIRCVALICAALCSPRALSRAQ